MVGCFEICARKNWEVFTSVHRELFGEWLGDSEAAELGSGRTGEGRRGRHGSTRSRRRQAVEAEVGAVGGSKAVGRIRPKETLDLVAMRALGPSRRMISDGRRKAAGRSGSLKRANGAELALDLVGGTLMEMTSTAVERRARRRWWRLGTVAWPTLAVLIGGGGDAGGGAKACLGGRWKCCSKVEALDLVRPEAWTKLGRRRTGGADGRLGGRAWRRRSRWQRRRCSRRCWGRLGSAGNGARTGGGGELPTQEAWDGGLAAWFCWVRRRRYAQRTRLARGGRIWGGGADGEGLGKMKCRWMSLE